MKKKYLRIFPNQKAILENGFYVFTFMFFLQMLGYRLMCFCLMFICSTAQLTEKVNNICFCKISLSKSKQKKYNNVIYDKQLKMY